METRLNVANLKINLAIMKKTVYMILTGIFCYRCSSNVSFADCTTKHEIVNCTFPRNYCFKQKNSTVDKNDQESHFHKGCTSADQCRQKEKSSMECCGDTLCNTGKLNV